MAERLGDAARLVGGHMAVAVALFWQGKLDPALAHFRRGFEMFDPTMQFPNWPGANPGVQCQFYPALISWMLGYPDRSLDELRAAVGSAETLGHPVTLAHTLCWVALVHIFRHEPPAVADAAGRALRICEEHHIPQFYAIALCANGWALGVSGEGEKRAGPNCPKGGELRSWGAPTHSVGVAQRNTPPRTRNPVAPPDRR